MTLLFSRSFGALRRAFLDISLSTGGGFETRIIERPGRWMSAPALADLSEKLRQVAGRTLPEGGLTYGVFSGDPARMGDSIVTLVTDLDTGQPVAFNALAVMECDLNGTPTEVLHLGLVMVDPDARSQGLSWILYGLTCLLLWLRNGLRPLWISNVTQVPAVVGMVSETFSHVAPQPQNASVTDFSKVLLARGIMAQHRHVFGVGAEAEYDETRGVIINAYTGGSDDLKKTYDSAPKHRNGQFNRFCAEQLDYDRGDDFLQLGQIDLNAAARYVARLVPRGSLAALAALTGVIALRRLVLPVLYWFDTSKPYGLLRARKR